MSAALRRWRAWWLLGSILAVIGVYLAWTLAQEANRIERFELKRLVQQSEVVEVNLTRQLQAIDAMLRHVQDTVPVRLGQPGQGLREIKALMPSVRALAVVDATGKVVLSSHTELLGRNVSQRDYFQAALRAPRPGALYLGPPFKTMQNQYVLTLSRVMVDRSSGFAGVVVASLEPHDIGILLNSVRYADDMRVALLHGDGEVLVTEPAIDTAPGRNMSAPGSPLAEHQQSQRALSALGGRSDPSSGDALTVLRTLQGHELHLDKPLVLTLTRGRDAVFAAWRSEVRNTAVAYGLLVLLSVWGLSVIQSQRQLKSLAAKRLALATQASGVGIWEFDLMSRRLQWDTAMAQLFGLDAAGPGSSLRDWRTLLSGADLRRLRRAAVRTLRENQSFDVSIEVRRSDGALRILRNRAAVYRDDAGIARRLIGAAEDVTERRQREAELRVAAAAFDSHESMIVTNARSEILRVNQAFCDLFGYSADEVIGRTPRLLKSGRQDAAFYAAMWDALRERGSWRGEVWDVRKGGEEFPCWISITAVRDEDGAVTHYVAMLTDITQRKAVEAEVRHLAFFDALTNLPNRRLLTDRLHQALAQAKREQGRLALMFIDLDQFKPVNDVHGHAAGDLLLQEVALRLRACVREADTVARVGGDEFVVLLHSIGAARDAVLVAEKAQAVLRQPFALPNDVLVSISSSVGIALYPEHGSSEAELSHNADVAMYAAKAAGRDRHMLLEPEHAAFDSTLYRYERIP